MVFSKSIVVVVDDDAAVRNSLKFSLEIDGFAVCTYASAEELLNADGIVQCQCLVVDQDVPSKTGLELVAALRKQGMHVPVILMSGHVTPALTRRAADAGVPVIEKPILGNALIELIHIVAGEQPV